MLHGRRIRRGTDRFEQGRTRGAVIAEHAHLDELVGGQRDVDLVDDRGRETLLADGHDGGEVVRAGAQRAAGGGIE